MEDLMIGLDSQREEVKKNTLALRDLEKIRLEDCLVNRAEVLEKEAARLQQQRFQNKELLERLIIYNRQMRESLQEELTEYRKLVEAEPRCEELLNLDIETNAAKYWQLLERKSQLKKQLTHLDDTIKM